MKQVAQRISHLWQTASRLVHKFVEDENGSLMPFVGGSMIVLVGAAGVAIDGARAFYVKDVLQKSLDSAGLAAGHAMEVDTMEADAMEFFNANIVSAGFVSTDNDMTIDISEDNEIITLTASASVEASFMRLFGFGTFSVSASTEITRETRGMELVLVMDNTGSMRWSNKMTTMQEAAHDLVDAVYGDDETNTNLWVGVVPYITQVNVGNAHRDWLSASGKTRVDNLYYGTEWKGCLEARADGEDLTDTPPDEIPFEPYYWEDTDPFEATVRRCSRWGCWWSTEDIDEDNNWIDDDSGDVTIVEANDRNTALGPNKGCGPQITPLVAEKTKIKDAIDEMAPWSFGGTAANHGLVWGWRVVSERWQGQWAGSPEHLPVANTTPFMDKVIVMLTDGVNEFIENDFDVLGYSDYTAFGRLSDLGYSDASDGRDDMDDRFDQICTNIKADGIMIYTITFGSTPDTDTQNAYSQCATKTSFYFHAPTAESLEDAFETIGRQLSNLRLSK